MNSELAPKIIVASGLAIVVGIIALTVSLRSHHPISVAQTSQPPAPLVQVPDATAPLAQVPDAPAPVGPIPNAAAATALNDDVDAKTSDAAGSAALEPKVAVDRHRATARASAGTSDSGVTPKSTVDSDESSGNETLAKSVAAVTNVNDVTMPLATSSTAADAQEGAAINETAGSDSRITTEVKSQFAADTISKDVDIGVTTTGGVVVLTGTLVTQDAIDHVRNVAAQVKDVKSVDTSAMKIIST